MPGASTAPPADSAAVPSFGVTLQPESGWTHRITIALASLAAHVLIFLLGAGIASLPGPSRRTGPDISARIRPRLVTPLVAPPVSVLTQRDPNKGKLTQEFNAAS